MPRPELLHLIDHAGIGGVNPLLESLSVHQSGRFGLHVASLGPTGPLASRLASGTKFVALDVRGKRDWARAAVRLAAYLRRERIALVQTHLFESSLVGVAAARLARVRSVVTAHHSIELLLTPSRLWRTLEHGNLRYGATFVSAPSARVASQLRSAHALPEAKVTVVPYWFDLSKWRAARTQRAAVRTDLHLGDRVVLVAAGRFSWIKNYPLMLRAFAQTSGRERALLLIAGEGPERAKVEALIAQLGISEQVRLLGMWKEMPSLFGAADLFVHASDAECFSQAAVEAAASSLPIVSTDVGGAHELVDDGGGGLLSPPGDVAALAARLSEAIAWDTGTRQARGRAAEQATRTYDIERGVARQEAAVEGWLA